MYKSINRGVILDKKEPMQFNILTLFPEVFPSYLGASIPKRGIESGKLSVKLTNIRDFTVDKHRRVDDSPFGGGAGMVMTPQPLFDCIDDVKVSMPAGSKVIFMSPGGRVLNNKLARELAHEPGLILLCGHYEGIDQRVIDQKVDMELSIGDYVLTGGELAALVVMDSIIRFIPGVVGNENVHDDESFEDGLLEYPQYTRPADYRGLKVPDVLLSGHHKNIVAWKAKQSIKKTKENRLDLWDKYIKDKE